jgi:DNA-binding Lrp family transcriptional regulator
MATAFVLISVASGREEHVHNELKAIGEICDMCSLFGSYDLIAKIEAEDREGLRDIVLTQIRAIPGVTETKTLIVAKLEE